MRSFIGKTRSNPQPTDCCSGAGYHAPRRVPLVIVLLTLALLMIGCGGAYKDALERGDQYAAAGEYDKAEAEYKKAIAIDSEDPEAVIRLEKLRKRRAYEQVERARALEARGETEKALIALQDAAALQPDDLVIEKELTRLTEELVKRAEAFLADDKARQAFELTTLVLKGAPKHKKAKRIDREARSELSAAAYERGQSFVERELLGNALVEHALALSYQPKFAEAKLAFGQVKLELQNELQFYVALRRFSGERDSAYLTKALTPEILKQTIDGRLLVRVVKARNIKEEPKFGVAVGGRFSSYAHRRASQKQQRSCDYVCGTDTKPNPDRGPRERELGQAEQRLAREESSLSREEQDVAKAEERVAGEQQDVDREQQDADRAREKLDRCMEKVDPEDSFPCSSEKSSYKSAQRDLESARRDVASKRSDVQRARDAVNRARQSRDRARQDVANASQRLRNTPTTIEVDRFCAFNYSVAIHQAASSVQVNLTMVGFGDGASILTDEPFKFDFAAQDTAFPAHRGRCPEVSSGDPLTLPSEAKMREELLAKSIAGIRSKVMASYDSYRLRFLTVARKHESGGNTEPAVEAYVRYVLTGAHKLDGAKAIAAFLKKTRGLGKLDVLSTL